MAKKRNWFNLVRKLFISDSNPKEEKKEKRRKWVFFGRVKVKSRLPSLAAPSPPPKDIEEEERRKLCEVEEEQSNKLSLNASIPTAATTTTSDVVFPKVVPLSSNQFDKQKEEHDLAIKIHSRILQYQKQIQEISATKIQSAFRGYLARKALRALKGIVKLQALIRGRNVRRQAMNTLRCLQSIINIQSQVCSYDENTQLLNLNDKIIKMDSNSQRRWDGSILTKEEADALFYSKKEAAIKRDRIKEYSFNHRNSAETERNKGNGRWKYWLENWVDTQVTKSKELEDLDTTVVTSTPKPRVEYNYGGKQLKLRNIQRQFNTEGLESPSPIPTTTPRRSFHRKQCSLGEENGFTISSSPPVIPTYMAATESAKAKVRSMSSPKLRPSGGAYDAYSDSYSPCKNRISCITINNSSHGRFPRSNGGGFQQQRSPSLKGIPGPVKCNNSSFKDLSFDSDCSFRTWDHQSGF